MIRKKLAELRAALKTDKGFSLVELIIVIAIMVALVAMLAPQFVKYVSKSRDAVVQTAAEDVLSVAKAEYSLGHLTIAEGKDEGKITVQTNAEGIIITPLTDLEYDDGEGNTGESAFQDQCGVDDTKSSASTKVYIITIKSNNFSTTETTGGTFTEETTDGGHSDTPVTGG